MFEWNLCGIKDQLVSVSESAGKIRNGNLRRMEEFLSSGCEVIATPSVNVSKRTELMAELHGTSRTSFSRDTLTVIVGFRHELNEHCIWIGSLGHDVRAPADDSLALIGYFGVQLLY